MIDPSITEKVQTIKENINEINLLMAELYKQNVELRIAYKDPSKGEPPRIELWKAIEHVDYLEKDTENE